MTREEAKQGFEDMKKGIYPFYPNEYFDMAIKALEQEPMVEIDLYSVIKQKYIEREVLDKIRAEIKAVSHGKWYVGRTDGKAEEVLLMADVLQILDKYKADRSEEE